MKFGPLNPRWSGDQASVSAGRQRARKLYPGTLACEVCGKKAERHHKDRNTSNNHRSNIAFLCNKHHKAADGRMTRPEFRQAWARAHVGIGLTNEHRSKIAAGLKAAYQNGRRSDSREKLSAAARRRCANTPKPTHCPRGHAYTPENIYIHKTTKRTHCRECNRVRCLANYYKRKAAQ